ncbi:MULTISPECIES: hypothetical protein [Paenibacillus]|nr:MULTISPECIES: hypothetical protein [Paenibacillus]
MSIRLREPTRFRKAAMHEHSIAGTYLFPAASTYVLPTAAFHSLPPAIS